MKKQHVILAIGVIIALAALYITTHGMKWSEFAAAFAQFHWIWLIPGLLTFYYSMYLRAVRWGLLFEPHYHLKGHQVFAPLMMCFAFNSILPARVGEVVRAYYVGKREKTGVTTALATVVAERILDMMVLLGMLVISLKVLPPIDPLFKLTINVGKDVTFTGQDLKSGILYLEYFSSALFVGMVLFMIPWTQLTMIRVIRRLPLLSARVRHALEEILGKFAQGFHALARPWVLVQIVFHSVVLWLLVAVSNIAIARGFGVSMSLVTGMALVTLIGIAILPASTPGYWGLYEAGGVFSLIVLGVVSQDQRSLALAYTLMIHLVQYIPIVAIGLFFAWRAQVRPVAALDSAVEESAEA